jgi:beta-galactosidase
MIIRDRNHPSILAWESSNGGIATPFAQALKAISVQWDPVHTRAQADRTSTAANGDIHACTLTGCEIGVKNTLPNMPAWGAGAWGRQSQRTAYDYELPFAGEFLQNRKRARNANCFGLAQWYLAETPGENPAQSFVDGTPGTSCWSFGSSMMDFSRIPKFLYYAYGACWTPFSIKAQVAIAHHWNRSGTVRVNVFSNCPQVRLSLNGTAIGTKVPNPWNTSTNGTTQTSTDYPCQCYWDVAWASGTLLAEGLDGSGNAVCSDRKITAGNPNRIVLTVDPHITKPNGETFLYTANATDAAMILATVVDANGVWCPTAGGNITWDVSGPGNYRGGTDQLVTSGQGVHYHAPGDRELAIEGGKCKVAVRTTFLPGTGGSTTFTVVPVGTPTEVRRVAAVLPYELKPQLEVTGRTVRYFINRAANVAVEIVNASGRTVERIAAARQAEGWHPVRFFTGESKTTVSAKGVYFVRLAVDGKYTNTKRLLVIR